MEQRRHPSGVSGRATLLLGDVGHHSLGVFAGTAPELGDAGSSLLVQPTSVQSGHGGHGRHAAGAQAAHHPGLVGQRGHAEGGHARRPGHCEGGRLLGERGPRVAAQAERQAACKQTKVRR